MTYVKNKGGVIMPRPRKCRQVCCMPRVNRFGPLNGCTDDVKVIQMTVDEYETIRLIDLEHMNQEECAVHMNVARTTVQGIYLEARHKLAQALVDGCMLSIEGGDYHLCDGTFSGCLKKGCRKAHMHQHGCKWDVEELHQEE